MNAQLDLSQLAIDREAKVAGQAPARRLRWLTRYAVPLGILVGFIILICVAAGSQLRPSRAVTVIPVVVKRAGVQQQGTPQFQSPGWVEPMPTPLNVPALANGVIEELFVVEGQPVTFGQPIAQLIDIDADLAVRQARARLEIREGELEGAIAEREAAQRRHDHPLHLMAALAEAESSRDEAKIELNNLPRLIERAQAEFTFAEQNLERKRNAGEFVTGSELQRAEADLSSAQASLLELEERAPIIRSNVDALERKVIALTQQLELLIDEKRDLDASDAQVRMATARRDESHLLVEQAELNLSRMLVTSPRDGRVLKLIAAPGDRVMGQSANGEHRSSTICQLYDPNSLQVRADVRLEDVPFVETGQEVLIETASSPDPIVGKVLLPTSTANIQKNTLEVKVELIDPPHSITPEMLVTATFLASVADQEQSVSTTSQVERVFAPEELLQSTDDGAFLWVVDSQNRAAMRYVELGQPSNGGLREITSGIDITDKLISSNTEDLSDGDRVRIQSDDQRLGM